MDNSVIILPNECVNANQVAECGFFVVMPRKGDIYTGISHSKGSVIFVLEGKINFSYDCFASRTFEAGDIFFLPPSAQVYGVAVDDSRLLILSFIASVDSSCLRCGITNYRKQLNSIDFDFRALKMSRNIINLVATIESYMLYDSKCLFLHQIKQNELFIIMRYDYPERDLAEFFYPILLGNSDFRSQVLALSNKLLSVEEFAAHFNLTPKSFTRKFKNEFGQSVHQWMLKRKADKIMLRLSIPSTTALDIVKDFEFSDITNFYSFCKKHYGCTYKQLITKLRG